MLYSVFLVEKSFSLVFGALVLQGRFDLAYLKDEVWTLVDFKTDNPTPPWKIVEMLRLR